MNSKKNMQMQIQNPSHYYFMDCKGNHPSDLIRMNEMIFALLPKFYGKVFCIQFEFFNSIITSLKLPNTSI